jgi:hypothetical protein
MLAPFRLAPVSLALLRSHFGQSLSLITLSRSCDGKAVRFRGEDGDLFAERSKYTKEFDAIRGKQEAGHTLSKEDWAEAQANAIAEYKKNNGDVDVSGAKFTRLGFN